MAANFTKFFRNGKAFSAYCRMRYGQSKDIWADTTLWQKSGIYAIAFDQKAADDKFGYRENGLNLLKSRHCEPVLDVDKWTYIYSKTGLEERAAGNTY